MIAALVFFVVAYLAGAEYGLLAMLAVAILSHIILED
jgi:hypothetical protein